MPILEVLVSASRETHLIDFGRYVTSLQLQSELPTKTKRSMRPQVAIILYYFGVLLTQELGRVGEFEDNPIRPLWSEAVILRYFQNGSAFRGFQLSKRSASGGGIN